jgi:hypothetical protein
VIGLIDRGRIFHHIACDLFLAPPAVRVLSCMIHPCRAQIFHQQNSTNPQVFSSGHNLKELQLTQETTGDTSSIFDTCNILMLKVSMLKLMCSFRLDPISTTDGASSMKKPPSSRSLPARSSPPATRKHNLNLRLPSANPGAFNATTNRGVRVGICHRRRMPGERTSLPYLPFSLKPPLLPLRSRQ